MGGRRRGTGRLYAGCQDTSIQVRPSPAAPTVRDFCELTLSSSLAQWIDLPPAPQPSAAHESSASHPSPIQSPHHPHSHASAHSYLSSSPLSHSPPIYKAPNKFFDSVSQADKNRARALGSRRGSGDSLNTLGKSPKDSRPATPNESSAQTKDGPGQAVELQFQAECITPFAHFGYVVCPRRLCLDDGPRSQADDHFAPRSTASSSARATIARFSCPDVRPLSSGFQAVEPLLTCHLCRRTQPATNRSSSGARPRPTSSRSQPSRAPAKTATPSSLS